MSSIHKPSTENSTSSVPEATDTTAPTPSPWLTGYYGHHDATGREVITGYTVEANVKRGDEVVRHIIASGIRSPADALLIAAAPELYAALKAVMSDNNIRAAISKVGFLKERAQAALERAEARRTDEGTEAVRPRETGSE